MLTVALFNLKGGVGKTTTAVNLAYISAKSQNNTVLWDWDPQSAASWYFDLEKLPKKAIKMMKEELPVGYYEVSSPYPRLSIIPADLSLRNVDLEMASANSARKLIQKLVSPLSENAATLIFDCPPVLSPTIEYVLSGVDIVLIPMIPTPLSLRAAEQAKRFLAKKKHQPKHIIGFFNLVDARRKVHKDIMAMKDTLPFPVLESWVPSDAAAEHMAIRREPLTSYSRQSRASQAYYRLWDELLTKLHTGQF